MTEGRLDLNAHKLGGRRDEVDFDFSSTDERIVRRADFNHPLEKRQMMIGERVRKMNVDFEALNAVRIGRVTG